MMPKGDTITAIMKINRSARADFLSDFSCDDLSCYLDRLSSVWPSTPAKYDHATPSVGSAVVLDEPKDMPFRFSRART